MFLEVSPVNTSISTDCGDRQTFCVITALRDCQDHIGLVTTEHSSWHIFAKKDIFWKTLIQTVSESQ